MSASTALIGLSMTTTLSMAQERENCERLAFLKRTATRQDMEDEYQFRKKQMDAINDIFNNIRNMLELPDKKDTVVNSILTDLIKASNDFEKNLISEAAIAFKDNNKPLETAQRYQMAVRDVIDDNKNLKEKTDSVTEFRNYARNGKLSIKAKCVIGSVIGALVTSSVFFGVVAGAGALALMTGPFGLIALAAVVSVSIISFGILSGIRMALAFSKNQDDKRGHDVSKQLTHLVSARQGLFQPTPQPKEALSLRSVFKLALT